MTVFVVKIGNNDVYKHYSKILENYFKKYNINFFYLEENKFEVHPSWLKLKCHDYVDDDFILCWDIDILPRIDAANIVADLNLNKINLVQDTMLKIKAVNNNEIYSFFKYNCGLIGMPKNYKSFFSNLFDQYSLLEKYPSYEQYVVNEELSKTNYIDVHELPDKWNTIYHPPFRHNSIILQSEFIHFTKEGENSLDLINKLCGIK